MKTQHSAVFIAIGCALLLTSCLQKQANAQSASLEAKTEDQQGFQVIGVKARTTNEKERGGNGEIPKLWQRMMQENLADKIPNRYDQNLIAVYTDYASDQNGEYTYVLGARVTSAKDVPPGFVTVNISAGKYAVVQSDKGPPSEIMPRVWRRIWAMSPAELGGTRAFKSDYEIYPPGTDVQNMQVTLYLGLK